MTYPPPSPKFVTCLFSDPGLPLGQACSSALSHFLMSSSHCGGYLSHSKTHGRTRTRSFLDGNTPFSFEARSINPGSHCPLFGPPDTFLRSTYPGFPKERFGVVEAILGYYGWDPPNVQFSFSLSRPKHGTTRNSSHPQPIKPLG